MGILNAIARAKRAAVENGRAVENDPWYVSQGSNPVRCGPAVAEFSDEMILGYCLVIGRQRFL